MYVSDGKIDARSCPDFGYKWQRSMVSFWIGTVERVKKLKSTFSSPSVYPYEVTSLTGRLGMSCGSQEKSEVTRVKLGRHVALKLGIQ